MNASPGPNLSWRTVGLRVAVFICFAIIGAYLSVILPVQGALPRSVMLTFVSGALANAVTVRMFESGRFSDFGLGWDADAGRDLLRGLGYGAAAAAGVVAMMLALNWAHFEPAPSDSAVASVLTSALLFFGAAGEEMMFHGYAFRLLVRYLGAFATILPIGVVFGLMHMSNQNSTMLGVVNTILWGILLGYACYHSAALWLPIGMHFGWNVVLPLVGANLSGFTMRVTGYALHPTAGVLLSGGAYGPEGSVLTTAAAAVLFWTVGRTRSAAEEEPFGRAA